MDFANELCLEKVDLGELYRVTIGAAEVHFVMVSADFEKNYLPDAPWKKPQPELFLPLSPHFSSLLSLLFCLFLKAVL